ncbi:DUF6252 family protein [Flavobacterium sp. J27]|uniref:DUF6252 family protein n=1 Tax=Flavobacterium sp. J27 TaxID=2060419 RepID=UPI00102FDD63|nr:DUF6252 family protein [Flavobacterium sp. J27]
MKTIFFNTFAIFTFFSLSLFSCSKNDDNNPPTSENTFFCKLDGTAYNPPNATGLISTITNTLVITGSTGSNSQKIQIFLPKDIAVGTYTQFYDYNADEFIQMYYSPPNSNDADDDGFATSGELVITQHDVNNKKIKGTFHFVTDPSINGNNVWNVTEGTFNITYKNL